MTSTRQIKRRMLRDRRYAEHYPAAGLVTGRRAHARKRADLRALRMLRVRRMTRLLRSAFERFTKALRNLGAAARRSNFTLVR